MGRFKLIFSLIAIVAMVAFCKKKEDEKEKKEEDTKGYVCNNGQCELVATGAKYLTLADCKSDCAPLPGKIRFTTNGHINANHTASYTMAVFVARSADDLDHGIHVDSKNVTNSFFGGPPNYVSESISQVLETKDLDPGTYYYSVVFTRKSDGNPESIQQKTDAITVNAGTTEQVTASF